MVTLQSSKLSIRGCLPSVIYVGVIGHIEHDCECADEEEKEVEKQMDSSLITS